MIFNFIEVLSIKFIYKILILINKSNYIKNEGNFNKFSDLLTLSSKFTLMG